MFTEGLAAQMLHVGPLKSERTTQSRLMDFIDREGFAAAGGIHEIYLDGRRHIPVGMQRILIRQPITSKAGD